MKFFRPLLLACVASAPLTLISSEKGDLISIQQSPTLGKNEVFIVNGDFNNNIRGTGWARKELRNSAHSTFEWVTDEGVDNSGCIKITNPADKGKASSGFSYKITKLIPNKMYRMTAQVKSEDVTNGRGAVIFDMSRRQFWNSSKHVLGTNDWQEVACDFYSDDNGNAEIVCALGYRLGGTTSGGYSTGTAWFDNVRVDRITDEDYCYYESKHFILYTDKEKAELENLKIKSTYLDKAYEAMVDLVGATPYNGRKISVVGTHGLERGYWALAGNPILLKYDSNAGVINNSKEITFGLIHEIGHDFNAGGKFEDITTSAKWNWNDELFANFRAFYGVMMANAPCNFSGKTFQGNSLREFYEGKYKASLTKGPKRISTYTFIRLGYDMGWDNFKKGFQDIYRNGKGPFANNWEKFDYMITTFQKYTKKDIRKDLFPAGELDLIKAELGGN